MNSVSRRRKMSEENNNGIEIFENTFRHQIQKDGEIKVQDNLFTRKFGDGPDEWPVLPNRYRLIWMPACPHAHKVIITRKLLGLEKVISLGTTGILRDPKGWVFSEDPNGLDPVLKIHYLNDVYTKNNPEYKERPTVPIIVDEKTGEGVNNDHFWLPIYFNTDWEKLHKENAPDLYPTELRDEIDELNHFIYKRVNWGVYDVGFARSQKRYDEAYDRIFEALDILEKRLSRKRFLFGDYITDSDIRLYPTLARFDVVYHPVFRCNRQRIRDYKNLWGYARDLYQTEGFRDTTYFDLIKKHYQTSPHLKPLWGNKYGLVAAGPDLSVWDEPHKREVLSKDPENKFMAKHK